MTDIYYSSSDAAALAVFCASFANVIAPVPGRAATQDQTLGDGTQVPSEPAAGDPAQFYACIRDIDPPAAAGSVILCDEAVGQAVCGLWA